MPSAERSAHSRRGSLGDALADKVQAPRARARRSRSRRDAAAAATRSRRRSRALENAANPLDERGSDERVRRLAFLKRQRRALADVSTKRDAVAAKLETCVVALQNIKLDLIRLNAGSQTPQHITSLAMDALNLADSVDSALYVADEMGAYGGERARRAAAPRERRVNDYLRDRVTVAVGDQYLIESEIGRGGMAVVYRATDLRLNRTVAIKVLPPELAFNARRARRASFAKRRRRRSSAIRTSFRSTASTRRDGDGSSTSSWRSSTARASASRLAREGAWPIDQTVRVLRDVADALAYAHARGVVHRDIKPDNILIDRASGRPMVTDFGIARAAAGETRLTVTGVAVGTPAYMSPEQALGEREVDGRSDLYSLGVVGYHMLAGEHAVQGGEHAGDAGEARVGASAPDSRAPARRARRISRWRSIARSRSSRRTAGPTPPSSATRSHGRDTRRTRRRPSTPPSSAVRSAARRDAPHAAPLLPAAAQVPAPRAISRAAAGTQPAASCASWYKAQRRLRDERAASAVGGVGLAS